MKKKLIMISFLPFLSTYTVANLFLKNEEIPKYDINSTLGEELFSGGSFINGISNSLFADSGNSYSGYYRGITSRAEGESDFYSFYDESEDNTFLRMANYNGEEDSYRTRSSFYFFDNENNVPENLPSTSYMNVAFDYRFFVSDFEKLSLNENSLILRYQSRGSANGKSGDVYLRDLEINEIDDETWHHYEFSISCDSSMSTSYGWFFFYYNNIKSSQNPTYFIDIDNFFVSLDETNTTYKNGDFENLKTYSRLLESPNENNLYPNLYYKKSLGEAATQQKKFNESYLRMNSDKNRSTFSVDLNNLTSDYLRISFDYKNLSYYKDPSLTIRINGSETSLLTQGILNNNEPFKDEFINSFTNYDKDNVWNNLVTYIDVSSLESIDSIDFVLDSDNDLAIDNLSIKEVLNIDKVSGDYEKFMQDIEALLDFYPNYKTEFYEEDVYLIDQKIDYINTMLSETSSEAVLNANYEELEKLFKNARIKGDYSSLSSYIDKIFQEMIGLTEDDFEKVSYLKFRNALDKAYLLDESSTKEEIDEAYQELKSAYEGLVRKD